MGLRYERSPNARKESQQGEDKNDFRLVFEIAFVGKIFENYKLVKLDIWRTFTDTTINKILNYNELTD